MTATDKAKQALQSSPVNGNNLPEKKVNIPATMQGLNTSKVKSIIERYKGQIEQALPKHLTVERMIQITTTLIARNPKLAECTTSSLIGAVVQASMLGLEPIPQLGYCYFIPFKNKHNPDEKGNPQMEVQFMIGYKGQIQLTYRSNEITSIYAQVVFEKDIFDYELGLDYVLKHKPVIGDRGKPIYAYAVVKYQNGGHAFEVMSETDIEKIRRRAQSQQVWDKKKGAYVPSTEPKDIWKNDMEAMWKKTLIKQVLKYAPMSIEYQKAMMTDGAVLRAEDFQNGEVNLAAVENADAQVEDTDPNIPDGVDASTGEVIEPNKQAESDGQLFQGEDTTNYESPKSVIDKIKSFTSLEALENWKKEKIRALQSFGGGDSDDVMEALESKVKELLKTKK